MVKIILEDCPLEMAFTQKTQILGIFILWVNLGKHNKMRWKIFMIKGGQGKKKIKQMLF